VSLVEEYTEEEAINVTIDNGYEGEEFETEAWKTRGCLKSNGTYKKFISKLNTIYNHVEVEGKGKKRIYILKDKKDKVSERELNYKGKVPSDQDDIMNEYIFNQILKGKNGTNFSQSIWAKELGFINPDKFDIKGMIESIKYVHHGMNLKYNSKEIVNKFILELKNRNKNIIDNSFKRLGKEGRIVVTPTYLFKTIENEMVEVTEEQYSEAQSIRNECLEGLDIKPYFYSQALNGFHNTKKMKAAIEEVNECLEKQLEIKYFFKSYRVVVVDETIHKEITEEEFNHAYFQRLVKLIQDRQLKANHQESMSIQRRFLLLNSLTLLDYIGIKEFEIMLKKEKKMKSEKMEKYYDNQFDLLIKESEEREKRRTTFGSI
jgi:hypothetical protein